MNDRMTEWEFEIFANVRIQTHDFYILDGLILAYFIVETRGFGSTPYKVSLRYSGLCSTIGFVSNSGFLIHYYCLVEFTFTLNLEFISR